MWYGICATVESCYLPYFDGFSFLVHQIPFSLPVDRFPLRPPPPKTVSVIERVMLRDGLAATVYVAYGTGVGRAQARLEKSLQYPRASCAHGEWGCA